MNFELIKKINISGIRFIKIIEYKDGFLCLGTKKYKEKDNIKKYALYAYLLNKNFEWFEYFEWFKYSEWLLDFSNIKEDYLTDLYTSLWLRDVYVENNNYYLLVDFNKNQDNKYFESNHYLLVTHNFYSFELVKKYDTTNIIHKEINNCLFASNIINNEESNWGTYLFEFIINEKKIQPVFDNYVNYQEDKGHLLHYLKYDSISDIYQCMFSVLTKEKIYKIYTSQTDDFIYYYNTKEVIFLNNTENEWYSYPCFFYYNHNNFLFVNQSDLGKNSEIIVFREMDDSLKFIEEKFQVDSRITNHLFFNDKKKYIYLNELENKMGNRYNEIIENKKDLSDYSTHSPSCIELYNVLKNLNICENDSIIDIGSGKGWALSLFHLFPFKKVTGIELSKKDFEICNENLELLSIQNMEVLNDNAVNFENYDNYNYLYFYNPFGGDVFEEIIQKIKNSNTKIIYNNIHEEEQKILEKYHFVLIKEEKGLLRNYFIYKRIYKSLDLINYTDQIKIINNDAGIRNINNIDKDLLIDNNVTEIKIHNDILLKSKKGNINTSYNINHLINNFKDENNLTPNIEIFENFFNKNKNVIDDKKMSLMIKDAVFFNCFTSSHRLLTHLMFDFTQNINVYYDLLIKNEDYVIIMEIIPNIMILDYLNCDLNFNHSNDNLYKFIDFMRNIGIKNNIVTISNYNYCQNFEEDSLFIENLYAISFKERKNINWVPLLSRFSNNNNYFCETLKNIIKKNVINKHYEYNKKKFLILEKRMESSYNNFNNIRNINKNTFDNLVSICNEYCLYHNLKLLIWDSEFVKKESLFEQFNISNNAEIIIGFGGSMWLFNYTMTSGKILCIGLMCEYEEKYKILFNMTLFTYNQLIKNKDIKNVYFHFRDDNDIFTYEDIVRQFLYY